jgi:competence protein ComEA
LLIAGLVVVLVAYLLIKQLQPMPLEEDALVYVSSEQQESQQMEQVSQEIVVHVAGAVMYPGIYTLQAGQRIEDALQLAGVKEDADVDALNRAALLSDGQKIVVPTVGEQTTTTVQQAEAGLVDLNHADLQQLMTLPGIGEVKGQAIIAYREQAGGFRSLEEIQQVDGIGAAIYAQIKNHIKI